MEISVPEIVPCYIICRELIRLESSAFIVVSYEELKADFCTWKFFPKKDVSFYEYPSSHFNEK